ncbi:MAG: M3 family oligoendopeptidase [Christensenellaceae bacterium]|nr:M3 family oligoendopeptidase [Christensenellaceae bacterium]
MQYENSLSQNYSTMVSQLKVVHEGKELNLSQISKYMNHSDRKIRKQYNALYDKAWLSIAKDLDELFDKLVKVRHEIALKTGFNNHTEYCFHKHGRTSYGRQELLVFSNNVESFISPLVNEMYKTQEKNFGHEIFSYDENFFVNKIDLNTDKDLISSFKKIFQSLSPQTHVFYEELVDREMYDVGLRDGKLMGAYSNYMPLFSMPYIFESYNGSFGAINTFAHECGHGLNSFMHRGDVFLNKASSDVYESHSMSMEFFVWPYINNIINEEQIPYYKYNKLRNALSFICYGTAIDQFQTMVYDKPEMTPEERLSLWKNLENRFLPWRKYESDGFNYQGRRWQQQIHVMRWPFYYIDYVLAQVCALQFWLKDEKCHETAWEKYIMFIKNSGGMSFLELVNSAQLKSPFNKESIIEISTSVKNYLDTVLNEVI